MNRDSLPVMICSSVIRSAKQGESHGGIFLVDLNKGSFKQVVDWNDQSISWKERGDERGLRGLAFYSDMTITITCNEIFFYDQSFRIVKSFSSPFLKHGHEIFVDRERLYVTSTDFDSILVFNLMTEEFENGYCYRRIVPGLVYRLFPNRITERSALAHFCPQSNKGPKPANTNHINNVFAERGNIYFSGLKMDGLMKIDRGGAIIRIADIPKGTHNVRFYDGNLLMNYTGQDRILEMTMDGRLVADYPIILYPPETLTHTDLREDFARQGFGRGLCTIGDYIICGSSPATVSLYRRGSPKVLRSVNLTKDIRNSIHGLEIYPYAESL